MPPGDVTFEFTSDGLLGTTFQCLLDGGEFVGCESPKTYSISEPGAHLFMVRAVDRSGVPDPTPAERKFEVLEPQPTPRDVCPDDVPLTAPPLENGCTPAEMSTHAAAVMTPAEEAVQASLESLAGDEDLKEAQRHAVLALDHIVRSGSQLGEGHACQASQSYDAAEREIDRAAAAVQAAVADDVDDAQKGPGHPETGDVQEPEMKLALTNLAQDEMTTMVEVLAEIGDRISEACERIAEEARLEGRVDDVDDDSRTITLQDGTRIDWALGHRPTALFHGATIAGKVLRYGDGSMLLNDLTVPDALPRNPARPTHCLDLKIAHAAQPLPPASSSYELHDAKGYLWAGSLRLEHGMRFAVADTGCPKIPSGLIQQGDRYVYAATLHLKMPEFGVDQSIALALRDGDDPVRLPWVPSVATSGELTMSVSRMICPLVGACRNYEPLSEETFEFRLRPLGSYGFANYDSTEFGIVDNGHSGDFDTTTVTEAGLSVTAADPGVTFAAEGYAPDGSRSVVEVGAGEPFAIHEDDFRGDVVGPFTFTGASYQSFGQTVPSGLRWARVKGTRDGAPFAYIATLPRIQRDRVTQCDEIPGAFLMPGPPNTATENPDDTYPPQPPGFTMHSVSNSYYKLPFDFGYSPVTLGNMNIDDSLFNRRHPTKQAYALDLGAPEGFPLLAARGGRVTSLEETDIYQRLEDPNPDDGLLNTVPCCAPADWSKFGNYIFILHEDGSYAVYYHLTPQGVRVQEGDRVHRGDWIGMVGTTGFSSGPHVHFAVHDKEVSDWSSRRIRFEMYVAGPSSGSSDPVYMPCYIPRAHDEFYSTNMATGS